jgi:truncated hemoglobin YjbI
VTSTRRNPWWQNQRLGFLRSRYGGSEQAGGPFRYTGKELGEAHKELHITGEEFDEVGAEIARALDHFNVPEREKQEVLAAIVGRKDDVVNP